MAKFLTTQGTSYYIEEIIRNAKKELVLISPFLQLSKTFFERIKDADQQNVKICVIYGKDELKPEEKTQLRQLKNLVLYYFENLHAKCYFNEATMVITSMNMYEFSEKKNREMGILISAKEDKSIFDDAFKEAWSIIHSAEEDGLRRSSFSKVVKEPKPIADTVIKQGRTKRVSYSHGTNARQQGFCIRCGKPIPADLDKPLCRDCYKEWAEWENRDFEEKVCHWCGKPAPTTMDKPLCRSCYDRSQR